MKNYSLNLLEKCWNQNLKDYNRIILANFAYVNVILEEFLYKILTFTLKKFYIKNRRREIRINFFI